MCRPTMLLSAVVVLFVSSSVSANPASPNQRLKVKYKIKKTNGEVQKQQIGERVMIVHPEAEEVDLNEARALQDMYSNMENDNTVEDVDTNTININMLDSLGLAPETVAKVEGYKQIVTGVMGLLQRTARAQDLTVGDLVFDIVKEIIADTLSGLVTRGLGLGGTARNGGEPFSFVSTVMNAVSKVASGKQCK